MELCLHTAIHLQEVSRDNFSCNILLSLYIFVVNNQTNIVCASLYGAETGILSVSIYRVFHDFRE